MPGLDISNSSASKHEEARPNIRAGFFIKKSARKTIFKLHAASPTQAE